MIFTIAYENLLTSVFYFYLKDGLNIVKIEYLRLEKINKISQIFFSCHESLINW